MPNSHVHYSDMPRRRLVDLAVQRAGLLQVAADALDAASSLDNHDAAAADRVARTIRVHLAQVEHAAAIRRGVKADDA